jgi:type I restriction enzyme, S subunit
MDTDRVLSTQDHISDAALEDSPLRLVPAGSVAFVVRSNVLRRRFPVALVPFPVTLNQDMRAVIPHDGILVEYLAQVCRARAASILAKAGRTDGSMAAIRSAEFLSYRIPVPPLDIQRELVGILTEYAALEAELEKALEAELEARRRQYAHCRSELLGRVVEQEWEFQSLRGLVGFTNGKAHERVVDPEGEISLMTARFISTQGRSERRVKVEDVLTPAHQSEVALVMSDLPGGRALARAFFVDGENKYAANQRICLLSVVDRRVISPRFLYYVMDRNEQLLARDNGVDQTHLKKDWILDVRIPVPPLEVQERIVGTLDRLGSSVDGLLRDLASEVDARRKQYEHYRDRLLTFPEAS